MHKSRYFDSFDWIFSCVKLKIIEKKELHNSSLRLKLAIRIMSIMCIRKQSISSKLFIISCLLLKSLFVIKDTTTLNSSFWDIEYVASTELNLSKWGLKFNKLNIKLLLCFYNLSVFISSRSFESSSVKINS